MMQRRSFIAALVATFATPAKMLTLPKPLVPGFTGFTGVSDYAEMFRREYENCPTSFEPLFKGEIGWYENIRYIGSKA